MKNFLFLASIAFIMTGCFAPVNSVYDSAALLEEGEFQIKGNFSKNKNNNGLQIETPNENYGGAISYGLSRHFNAGLRYERIANVEQLSLESNPVFQSFDFLEARGKVNLLKNRIAVEGAIGSYFQQKELINYSFEGRLFFTHRFNKNFELSAIPKLRFVAGIPGGMPLTPGIIFGAGISTDLDKWAIRPEIGYDGNFTAGIGFNYNFSVKTKKNKRAQKSFKLKN